MKNPYYGIDAHQEPEVPQLSLEIYKAIEAEKREKDTNVFRASSLGSCERKLTYQMHGHEGNPLPPRALMVFSVGTQIETALKHFIRQAVGHGKLYKSVNFGKLIGTICVDGKTYEYHKQEEWRSLEYGFHSHPDAIFETHEGEFILGEVKTTTSFGFKDFKTEGVGDYIYQAHANMMTNQAKALKIKKYHFIYMEKEACKIWDRVFNFDPVIEQEIIARLSRLREAEKSKELLPPRFDGIPEMERKKPTGRVVLPWNCSYCSYVNICKPDYELEFKKSWDGNYKPQYVKKDEYIKRSVKTNAQ